MFIYMIHCKLIYILCKVGIKFLFVFHEDIGLFHHCCWYCYSFTIKLPCHFGQNSIGNICFVYLLDSFFSASLTYRYDVDWIHSIDNIASLVSFEIKYINSLTCTLAF